MNRQVDFKLFFAVVALIIFGMIMISSVSVYPSFKVTSNLVRLGQIENPYNYFYVVRNITHVLISITILVLLVKVPYTFFEKNARYFFFGSLMLLFIVLVIGVTFKGARGWINIPGIPFTIQPTEFLKFCFVVYLAYFFKAYKNKLYTFKEGFVPFLSILGIVLFLVALQPDFGTIMVLVPVATLMFFVAGANVRHIFLLMFLGLALITSVYAIGDYDKATGKNLNTLGYITQRIDNYLAPEKDSIKNKTINYQTEQGLIAIGSGGFTGLGFGKSVQKYGFLPEVQGDFIFSVIVEEMGFLGAFIIISIYLFIGYRGVYIALRSQDLFAKYGSIGITALFLIQTFINIGVNLNIIPLTGITLPFISYGGSSLLASMIGLAFLLNISRYIDERPKSYNCRSFSIKKLF